MKYSTKLLIANCIPILVFAAVSMIMGLSQFHTGIYQEKQNYLKSSALAAMVLYSSHGYGDYGRKADGNIWRGMNFNVSTETSIVDDLKRQINVDTTFFFGADSVMTSIIDEDGHRAVHTNALNHIKEFTLTRGSELWCRQIKINGKSCQAYVIPIRQESDNSIAGAMMVSVSTEDFDRTIKNFLVTTSASGIIILCLVYLVIRWYTSRFSEEFYEVSDKSKRDLLTGLYNKGSFENEVKNAIAARKPNNFSVLMIFDFDNFKYVNDTFGHQIGDEVLKAFASILRRAFRTQDIIGRVGGDEFMVYMPDLTEEFLSRSDRISQEILDELKTLEVGPATHFSCSIGIGTDNTDYDFQRLYKLADSALYQSKENGKACYVRYSSEEHPIVNQ